jgi:hypothetical protein
MMATSVLKKMIHIAGKHMSFQHTELFEKILNLFPYKIQIQYNPDYLSPD